MKAADVQIGAVYLTRIGEELARVEVVREAFRDPGTKRASGRAGPRRWYVRREGSSSCLPKPRNAAALHTEAEARANLAAAHGVVDLRDDSMAWGQSRRP